MCYDLSCAHRMGDRLLWLLILPVWAVEYRLQVTNINYLTFSSYLDRSSASPRGQETMQAPGDSSGQYGVFHRGGDSGP